MKKESKRVKINGIEETPVDLSNWYANRKKQELAEQERKRKEKEQEEERINKIECPLCKSTDKIRRIKRKSNGIYGSGSSSWITDDYLVCRSCGIHYDDVSKLK